MVKEVYGDLLKQPVDIIAHQTNCAGVMGAGIALQIKKSLLTSEEYNKYVNICKQQGADLLGKTQLLEAPDGRIIANCFGENIPTGKGKDTDYDALMHAVAKLRNYAKASGLKVGVPGLMGCGLAGGDWRIVKDMLYKLFGADDEPELIICYFDKDEFYKNNPDQKPRQVHTERGDIYVERTFRSKEEASAEGYYYSFRSSELGKDLFSKTLDDRGLRHSFAIVEE